MARTTTSQSSALCVPLNRLRFPLRSADNGPIMRTARSPAADVVLVAPSAALPPRIGAVTTFYALLKASRPIELTISPSSILQHRGVTISIL